MGSFSDTGYERTTDIEIVRELERIHGNVFGIINNSVSDIFSDCSSGFSLTIYKGRPLDSS